MRSLAITCELVRFYRRIVPNRWYRRAPYLPVPPLRYLEWRLQTAYGMWRPGWSTVLGDLWQFGAWLRAMRQARRKADGRQ